MRMYTLHNGIRMPAIGFGTSQIPNEKIPEVINSAVEVGYRLFDTAEDYLNECEVGDGILQADVLRSEVFLTSKLAFRHHGYDTALRSFEQTLKNLKTDYLDLYMLHWPIYKDEETWKALERLYDEKLVRAIGVCNFLPEHLENLHAEIMPMVCQYEISPCLQQKRLREYYTKRGIVSQAYSPMMQGKAFSIETLQIIAKKHGKKISSIVESWLLHENTAMLVRSASKAHQLENLIADENLLDTEDLEMIAGLESGEKLSPDPKTFGPMMLELFRQHEVSWEEADSFAEEMFS